MKTLARKMALSVGLLALIGCAWGAEAPEGSVALSGNVAKPQEWTAAKIRTEFAKELKEIKYTSKEVNHTAHAVPLMALINAAGPQVDAKIKGHALRFVVVVEATDGYVAAFSLMELSPDIGNREAWIALDIDDKPLSEQFAPASLIVPSDKKPERWVHGIKAIRVLDMTAKKE